MIKQNEKKPTIDGRNPIRNRRRDHHRHKTIQCRNRSPESTDRQNKTKKHARRETAGKARRVAKGRRRREAEKGPRRQGETLNQRLKIQYQLPISYPQPK